jgi:hypothetical protein
MAARKQKPTRTRTRATGRAGGRSVVRGSGSRVSGAVHVSPRFTLFGNVTLFRFGAGGGGRGKARTGQPGRGAGRGGTGVFAGLRATMTELRGAPVSRQVKRGGVRRPRTVQEWEADRRDQQRLYAELDPETTTGSDDLDHDSGIDGGDLGGGVGDVELGGAAGPEGGAS